MDGVRGRGCCGFSVGLASFARLATVLMVGACGSPAAEIRQSHDLVALSRLAGPSFAETSGFQASMEDRVDFVPAGERVDFHRELEPHSVLRFEASRFVGDSRGELARRNVSEAFGCDQAFADLIQLEPDPWLQIEAEDVVDEGIAFVEAVETMVPEGTADPLFLYLHFQDPHNPYLPPDEHRERLAPDSEDVLTVLRRNPRKEIWEPSDGIIPLNRQIFRCLSL